MKCDHGSWHRSRSVPLEPTPAYSNGSQPIHGIREALHQIDQQGGLCIGFRAPLLPVLQRAHVRAKVRREERPMIIFVPAK